MSEDKLIFKHIPVLLEEVLGFLDCKSGDTIVDATLGGAGHSIHIAEKIQSTGRLVGIDRDLEAINAAKDRLDKYKESVLLAHGNFVDIEKILSDMKIDKVDAILMDLGVSSHQLDQKHRGFSFRQDSPLDMRMNFRQDLSAYNVLNEYSEEKLAYIIKEYGEERWAKRIAKFIVDNRPLNTTGDLEKVIKMAIPKKARAGEDHPARRTFQGIRIEVNQELEILPDAIKNAVKVLNPYGRLCVISFHSLEDRIVKHTFKHLSGRCVCPFDYIECTCGAKKIVKILTSKPITPSDEELSLNSRSRSAKLRVCEKLEEQ